MPAGRALTEGFGSRAEEGGRPLAEEVLERGGLKDAWNADLTEPTIAFLGGVAHRLSELLWDDVDRRIDIAGRAKTEGRELIYRVNRLDAPGILYAIAPWTELPRGTIGDLHRACRPMVAAALVPFIGRVLKSWADRGIIEDIGKRDSR